MLYNLEWLKPGEIFPPLVEVDRIRRYRENEALFDGDHFGDALRGRIEDDNRIKVYRACADRISRVIGNFDEIISFPILLNYQRLLSLKMADLVCGERPSITSSSDKENKILSEVRRRTRFDSKLYATIIDISRYGDAIWRTYLDDDEQKVFTCWDPKEWYPIVAQDGTHRIKAHVLCWRENKTQSATNLPPDWVLHVQIHWCDKDRVGTYEKRTYQMDSGGTTLIQEILPRENVSTGMSRCAIQHIVAYETSSSIYGYDDYVVLDSILSEIMARIGQISVILDKHADPNMTGPVSMLKPDPKTGEFHLERGRFFATAQGDSEPKYLTWDGQLTAAFSQLEFLCNQLYILSEMGAAILGGQDGSSVAISGTAMRFKMVNPLSKARRITNSLTEDVRQLMSELTSSQHKVEEDNISVFWADGLPEDPRENAETCKLATGAEKMMPLQKGIMEYFGRSAAEASEWVRQIQKENAEAFNSQQNDPNKPGPQDGTGVNPTKKGSETGMTSFHSSTNGEA